MTSSFEEPMEVDDLAEVNKLTIKLNKREDEIDNVIKDMKEIKLMLSQKPKKLMYVDSQTKFYADLYIIKSVIERKLRDNDFECDDIKNKNDIINEVIDLFDRRLYLCKGANIDKNGHECNDRC